MKTFRKLKKGFTIVELVIVIAVIAILAAVLVPTFANLIDKANQSSDTSLVRNLNTVLISEEMAGEKPTSMGEVLALEEENGYKVENLQAKAKDYKLVWNPVTNRFYKAKVTDVVPAYETYPGLDDPEQKPYEMWTIDSKPSDIFSTYLYQYQATEEGLNITTGLDVGNETVTSIQYVRAASDEAQDVVIRTNSETTTLIVNDTSTSGKIYHYGVAGYLNIIECAMESYHEAGYIPQGTIAKGHIVNEGGNVTVNGETKTAGVENLFIKAKDETSFDTVIVEAKENAVLPALDRSQVNIPENGTKVVDIKTATNNKSVWLYANGIYENIKITDTSAASIEDADSAPATTTELGKVAYEIANAAKRNEAGQLVDSDGVTVVEKDRAIVEDKPTNADVEKGNTLFAGGVGTENNPYLISNADYWKNFADYCNADSSYTNTEGKCFKITDDIDVSSYQNQTLNVLYFGGRIDWAGHTILGLSGMNTSNPISPNTQLFRTTSKNAVIENMNFTTYAVRSNDKTGYNLNGDIGTFQLVGWTFGDTTIKNITINGSIIGVSNNNSSPLVYGCAGGAYSLSLINCTNNASVVCAGYTSAFVANIQYADGTTLNFENCVNNGTIISTGSAASMLISNPTVQNNSSKVTYININNCVNYGKIISKNSSTLFMSQISDGPYAAKVYINGSMIDKTNKTTEWNSLCELTSDCITGTDISIITTKTLTIADDKYVFEEVVDAEKYELTFSFSAGGEHRGGRVGYSLYFNPDNIPSDIMVGSWITKSEAEASGKEIVAHNEYGTTYYTCDGKYVFYEDGAAFLHDNRDVFVSFIAYGENDTVLSIATYQYAK